MDPDQFSRFQMYVQTYYILLTFLLPVMTIVYKSALLPAYVLR